MGATGCGNGGYGCHRLESTPSSAYYQTRRGQRRKDDVPVSRLMVCGNLFPCRVQIPQWPCNDEIATRNRHVHVLGQVHRVRCNDESASRNLLAKALAQVFPQPLVTDAGYGAECVHESCRERWRVNSWIPLAVHSRNGQVRGRWRFPMREMPKVYRQRWHVESFLSGLNRTTGSQLTRCVRYGKVGRRRAEPNH
jgi:hypothetical protein